MKTRILSVFVMLALTVASQVHAQGTAFTYQGRLNTATGPATGSYDLTFTLFSVSSGAGQVGTPQTNSATVVSNGLFTVLLDFGNQFPGAPRWLEIGVRSNSVGSFQTLAPRQQLTPTPYAIYAESASATNLVGQVPDANLATTFSSPHTFSNPGDSFTGNGSGLTGVNAATLGGLGTNNFWQTVGNFGTTPGVNFLGTKDATPLWLDVNGSPVLKISTNNSITMGNGTLGGAFTSYEVALGQSPKATGNGSVAIGWNPTSSGPGSVAIGESVTSSGNDSFASGYNTRATNDWATAMGNGSVAGGSYSMALGDSAQALHTGSYVWSDSSGGPYASTGVNQYLIRAAGGVGIGITAAPQQYLSIHGGLNVDQANYNGGFLNNGSTNGYGLSFGSNSGEGIASKRTAGGNQYGLDFYTSFTTRISILNSGFVGIGRQSQVSGNEYFGIYAPVTNTWVGMYIQGSTASRPFYGYANPLGSCWTENDGTDGNKWKLYNNGYQMTVTTAGQVGIGTTTPASGLEVASANMQLDNGDFFITSNTSTNNGYGLGYRTGLPGISSGNGPCLYGYNGGCLAGLSPFTVALSWDYSGDIWVSNNCSVGTLSIRGGADLAEPFNISSANGEVASGAVVIIDEKNPGHLKLSDRPYDTRVAGIVSGAKGINPGIQMHQQGLMEGSQNVALSGRVYVQADASTGAIIPGDLLTTSSTPGYAMKVTDHAKAQGAILGKAMSSLSGGKGMVLVLVSLQ